MKRLMILFLLGLCPTLSFASDSVSEVLSRASLFSNDVDVFISGAGGYQTSASAGTKYNGPVYSGRLTASFPLTGNFGFQGDIRYEDNQFDVNIADANIDVRYTDLAAHFFWRDQSQFLIGILAQHEIINETISDAYIFDLTKDIVGLEFQYFLPNATLSGKLVNSTWTIIDRHDDGGLTAGVEWKYFFDKNFYVAPGIEFISEQYADGGKYQSYVLSLASEYKFANNPISLFVKAEHNNGQMKSCINFDETTTKVMAGITVSLASIDLYQRDRSGASLNPISNVLHSAGSCGPI